MLCLFRSCCIHGAPPTLSVKTIARIVQMISHENDVEGETSRLINIRLCAACYWLFTSESKLEMDANAKSFVDHGLVKVLSKVVGKGIDDLSSESFEYLLA